MSADDHVLQLGCKKAEELIAYLVCENRGATAKRSICSILWPDSSEKNARDSLYKVCNHIREFSWNGFSFPLILRRGKLWLDMSLVESDTIEFLSLYKDKANIESCKKAVDLYSDALLLDEYYEWTAQWEAFYEIRYLELLDTLINYYSECGNNAFKDYYREKYARYMGDLPIVKQETS